MKMMFASQVVDGAGKAYSSLGANLGAVTLLEKQLKIQDNTIKATEITLTSVKRREYSSRIRWIGLCINEARLGEVDF
jgi:hypothetical protein